VRAKLLVLLVLMSCTSPYQKRGTEPRLAPLAIDSLSGTSREARIRQINIEGRSIEDFEEATIGIIEFDDEANTNPAQVQAVLEMLKEKTQRDALMVVFIHGWHHGARVCDRDLACFRRVLQQLKLTNPNRNVVGVFIGWRGESLTLRGVNLATIWRRKRVAEHIGRTGLKEVLLALQDVYRAARGNGHETTMVSVGHSLGGAMLYSAVKGKLSGNVADIERHDKRGSYRVVRAEGDRVVAARRGHKALRAGFGDLVVLVNPAIEAREYGAFAADLPDRRNPRDTAELIARKLPYDANEPYDSKQLPVMLTIASTADTAVGRVFPFAQIVSAVPLFRLYQWKSIGWHGHGRYAPHFTHTLTHPVMAYENQREPVAGDCDCSKAWQTAQVVEEERTRAGLDLKATGEQRLGSLVFDLVPERRGNWDPRTPYLVISASPGVIREHSDIFNPVFVGFLTRYIRAIEEQRQRSGAVQAR
jgi:hypothetical protein